MGAACGKFPQAASAQPATRGGTEVTDSAEHHCPVQRARLRSHPAARSAPIILALALVCGGFNTTCTADEVAATSGEAVPRNAGPLHSEQKSKPGLEERVQLLAKELDLDARQQTSVKAILAAQRAEMLKAWSDPTVPAAVRVGTTQAISERTSERIRAVLTESQRDKYLKSRLHETPVGAPGGDVEKWMPTAQPH